MTLQNGSVLKLKALGQDALNWLNQLGMSAPNPADTTINSEYNIVTVTNKSYTFSEYKTGGISDDDAMAAAVAHGGTLIIDQGLQIHLTRTFTINKSMQIISSESTTFGSGSITSSSAGGLFRIAASTSGASIAPVLFQGLNIVNIASSGSIIVMSGDHTVINNCQFANVAGNSASMVKFQGYDQVIENSIFANYEPTAYSWDATWVDGYNGVDGEPVNDRIVGGAAFGPGKGGLIANAGLHFTEGFSIDDWVCATEGVQVQASDVYSLEIRGGVFDGAKGSAIVLGGGNALVQSVVIQGAYISAAGTAIDAAPISGSGVNDLTVDDNQISGTGIGFALNGSSGHAAIIGNIITSSLLGLNIQNPASQVMVIGNTVSGGGILASDNSSQANEVYFGNTISGTLRVSSSTNSSIVISSNGGATLSVTNGVGAIASEAAPVPVVQAVQAASTNVHLPDFSVNLMALAAEASAAAGANDTFSHFKSIVPGTVLTDDQAFALAVATLGAVHGTLVIDNGLTIHLTQAVQITNAMSITSAGSGLDTSSLITTSAAGGIFQVRTTGSVLIQGLNFKSGSSDSIITTGTGNTVLRADAFTNLAGNASPMVILQGPNQLIQDSYFYNNEATAYDWSADYINPSTAGDTSTTVSGGWAYGIGKGGLIGGNNAGPIIQGFNINNWTNVSKGATQIEADNVASLNIQGGVYDYSSDNAIVLGGGSTRIGSVTVNGAFISAAGAATVDPTKGTGINAGLTTGGGVANLVVADNQINTVGTGVLVGGMTGNATISGNNIRTGKVGIDLRSPTGVIMVLGNQDNPNSGTLAVQSTTAVGSSQTFVANTFNGTVSISQVKGSTLTQLDNIGSGTQVPALGIVAADPMTNPASATTAQIAALPLATVGALSSTQIAALSSTQLSALTSTQIKALTTAQLGALTSTQVGALTSAQVTSLTTEQLGALTSTQVGGLTSTQVISLTTAQMRALTSAQVGALTSTQVTSLTTAQLGALTSTQVGALTSTQLTSLTTAQVGSLSTEQMSTLTSTQVHALTTAQMYVLTSAQVGAFTTSQMNAMTGVDLGALNPTVVGALTTAQLSALSPVQMLGFNLSQLSRMSTGQLETLMSSQFGHDYLFDAKYYLAQNPDVAASGADPYQDFMTYGWKEGRNPSPYFNTKFYLAENPKVKASGVNPLAQFEISGWNGTTDPSASFSDSKYLAANPDVAAAKMDPLLHYIISGQYQGRAVFASTASVTNTVGVSVSGLATSNTASVRVPAPPAGKTEQGQLILRVSETAWHGNAQFSLTVDGVPLTGTLTASASHAAGQSQTFTVDGQYAPGPHTVGVTFLNSLNGSDGGRALFVDGMTFDGKDTGQTAMLSANGTSLISTAPTICPTTVTMNLSEDGFKDNAAAFISIDGKVQGGMQTITASHSSGATQAMKFQVDMTPGVHVASISLLNNTDGFANGKLYVDSLNVSSSDFVSAATSLNSGGSSSFAFVVQPASISNGTLFVTATSPSALSLLVPSF